MADSLTPYGKGRAWMRDKGPYARLSCMDAIEAYGYDLDSLEAEQFRAGCDSVSDDGLDEDER